MSYFNMILQVAEANHRKLGSLEWRGLRNPRDFPNSLGPRWAAPGEERRAMGRLEQAEEKLRLDRRRAVETTRKALMKRGALRKQTPTAKGAKSANGGAA